MIQIFQRWRAGALLAAALAGLAAPATAQSLDACFAALRAPARAAGISDAAFERHTSGLLADPSVLEKLDNQPEFKLPIWDYLAALVDDERIDQGRALLLLHRDTLQPVEARYGVDAATVVAVWGVESDFGQSFGRYPLLQALGTLSCHGRRQAYFRGEFFSALRIVQSGDIAPEQLRGSWAGAFGHTQFMPTTFERLAVDFDADGRRDLIASIPDALASTANFLQQAGWRPGLPWGFEVALPPGFPTAGEGRKVKRALSEWSARGLRLADGRPLPATAEPAGLMTLAGPSGPAFLVTRNFDALYSYNAAESYGLAIAHLSDRLRGGGAFATRWPTDDLGLSRAERRELQRLLAARGHDIGEIDGRLGEKARAAIRAEQARLGQPASGRAGQQLLRALQQPV